MKKLFVAAVAAVAFAGAASAADLQRGPYSAPMAPIGVYNWSGMYGGVSAGYQWGETTGNTTEPSGIAGGVTLGYNWQSGAFVYGGETDLQISGAEDTFAPWKFSNPWFGTVRARGGYAFNNLLFYGTLGLAYGGITGETVTGFDESRTHLGWTAGFGVEVGLNQRWSAKAEYLYIDLADRRYTVTGVDNGLESNLLRFGVNYHF